MNIYRHSIAAECGRIIGAERVAASAAQPYIDEAVIVLRALVGDGEQPLLAMRAAALLAATAILRDDAH